MKTAEKYVAVNGAWPIPKDQLPPLTPSMARKAFRVLYRHRFHQAWTKPVATVKGRRRRTWWGWLKVGRKGKGGHQRQVAGMVIGPDAGWHDFIHDLSHWMHSKQYPGQDAHRASSHAVVERDLIEQVVRRGWLVADDADDADAAKPAKAAKQIPQSH